MIGNLEREYKFQKCGNIVATVWRDKKLVYVMSSHINANNTTNCQRKQKDGTSMTVPIPACISLYNMYMGGVDTADQLRSYYQWRMKSRKYYM